MTEDTDSDQFAHRPPQGETAYGPVRKSFQFKVKGDRQTGVVYATRSFHPHEEDKALGHATRTVAKRSGDANPEFVRTTPPERLMRPLAIDLYCGLGIAKIPLPLSRHIAATFRP
jgi:hypothetical protein